jgi:hypothetical protein
LANNYQYYSRNINGLYQSEWPNISAFAQNAPLKSPPINHLKPKVPSIQGLQVHCQEASSLAAQVCLS